MRDEIGVDRLMWGADYPHLEGAAPVHRLILRQVFGGMPEEDIRRMLGLNAIGVFGFDGDLLQAVADRVGPTVADLSTTVAMDDIPKTFSWSLARPVPLSSPTAAASCRPRWSSTSGSIRSPSGQRRNSWARRALAPSRGSSAARSRAA